MISVSQSVSALPSFLATSPDAIDPDGQFLSTLSARLSSTALQSVPSPVVTPDTGAPQIELPDAAAAALALAQTFQPSQASTQVRYAETGVVQTRVEGPTILPLAKPVSKLVSAETVLATASEPQRDPVASALQRPKTGQIATTPASNAPLLNVSRTAQQLNISEAQRAETTVLPNLKVTAHLALQSDTTLPTSTESNPSPPGIGIKTSQRILPSVNDLPAKAVLPHPAFVKASLEALLPLPASPLVSSVLSSQETVGDDQPLSASPSAPSLAKPLPEPDTQPVSPTIGVGGQPLPASFNINEVKSETASERLVDASDESGLPDQLTAPDRPELTTLLIAPQAFATVSNSEFTAEAEAKSARLASANSAPALQALTADSAIGNNRRTAEPQSNATPTNFDLVVERVNVEQAIATAKPVAEQVIATLISSLQPNVIAEKPAVLPSDYRDAAPTAALETNEADYVERATPESPRPVATSVPNAQPRFADKVTVELPRANLIDDPTDAPQSQTSETLRPVATSVPNAQPQVADKVTVELPLANLIDEPADAPLSQTPETLRPVAASVPNVQLRVADKLTVELPVTNPVDLPTDAPQSQQPLAPPAFAQQAEQQTEKPISAQPQQFVSNQVPIPIANSVVEATSRTETDENAPEPNLAKVEDGTQAFTFARDSGPAAPRVEQSATLSQLGAQPSSAERHLDLAHQEIWLDELARDIVAARDNDSRLSFRLSPERLGRLDVDVLRSDAGLSVNLTTSSAEASAAIASAQPRLVEELKSHGARVIETQVRTSDPASTGSNPQSQRNSQNQEYAPFLRTAGAETASDPTDESTNATDRFA